MKVTIDDYTREYLKYKGIDPYSDEAREIKLGTEGVIHAYARMREACRNSPRFKDKSLDELDPNHPYEAALKQVLLKKQERERNERARGKG